jgi:hypothetical protein
VCAATVLPSSLTPGAPHRSGGGWGGGRPLTFGAKAPKAPDTQTSDLLLPPPPPPAIHA